MRWPWPLALLALLAASPAACDSSPAPSSRESLRLPVDSADDIPKTPVTGTIRGQSFEARDVRLVRDQRSQYEHTDLLLSAASAETPCGKLDPADPVRVWLRRSGPGPLQPGEVRIGPQNEQPWEIHYQLRQEGTWVGVGEAVALLRLHLSDADAGLGGEIAACFADGMGSCVAGSFVATACPSTIDLPLRGNEPVEQLPVDAGASDAAHEAGP